MAKTAKAALVVSVLLLALAVLFIGKRGQMHENIPSNSLRVAFPANDNLGEYDPAKVSYTHQYVLLENLYSQLVTYDTRGEIVSGLAERFEWDGNNAKFTLRQGLVTAGGQKIDNRDVVLSLKRLLILQSNTHGDLNRALCGKKKLVSLDEDCENILIEGDSVVILRLPNKDPFLFSMLTAVDFSIIPRNSIDTNTLKIIDYKNTSGPYYAKAGNVGGEIELNANLEHFQYSKSMPAKITIVPSLRDGKSASLELFKERKVDMLTTAEMSNSQEILKYSEEAKDVNLFKTVPIKLAAITFTPTGISKLPEKDRFLIASLIRRTLVPGLLAGGGGAEATEQLFPPFGQGALSGEQLKKLAAKLAGSQETYDGRFTVWNLPKEYWPALRKRFPNAEFKYVMAIPGFADYKALGEKEPELYFLRTDTSLKEDISFFSYYMSGYFFSISGKKGAEWVRNYAGTADISERMKLFNKLHFNTLYGAVTFPLTFSPYVVAVRKPWKPDFFGLHAGTTFWRMKWS